MKKIGGTVTKRVLASNPPPFVDSDWIATRFTPDATEDQKKSFSVIKSEELSDELFANDIIVIGCPIYNFGNEICSLLDF